MPRSGVRPSAERPLRVAVVLLLLLVLLLSVRGVVDVLAAGEAFPPWFAPLFTLGLLVLAGVILAGRPWTAGAATNRREGLAVLAWSLLVLSYPCVSILHSGYPFRTDVGWFWREFPSLRFNLVLAGLGLGAAVIGATLRILGRERAAWTVIVAVGFVLLLPNDDCPNPFNAWWTERVGASPLMYVPNAVATVLVVAVDRGVRPRLHLVTLALVVAGTAALGIGHRTGVVW